MPDLDLHINDRYAGNSGIEEIIKLLEYFRNKESDYFYKHVLLKDTKSFNKGNYVFEFISHLKKRKRVMVFGEYKDTRKFIISYVNVGKDVNSYSIPIEVSGDFFAAIMCKKINMYLTFGFKLYTPYCKVKKNKVKLIDSIISFLDSSYLLLEEVNSAYFYGEDKKIKSIKKDNIKICKNIIKKKENKVPSVSKIRELLKDNDFYTKKLISSMELTIEGG